MMNIILKEDVPHLGVVGDLVSVKDGYGRNYLVPQGKAVLASSRSVKQLEHQKRVAAHHREQATAEAQTGKVKIEQLSVCLTAKTAPPPLNEDHEPVPELLPKLFGSVTNRNIAGVLKESGFKVDHRRVTLTPDRINAVGKYSAAIRLDGGIIATLPFWVVAEGTEDIEAEKTRIDEAYAAIAQKAAAEAAEVAAAAAAAAAEVAAPAVEAEPAADDADSDGAADSDDA